MKHSLPIVLPNDFNAFFVYETFQISELSDNITQTNVHWGQDCLFFHCGIVFAGDLTLSVNTGHPEWQVGDVAFCAIKPMNVVPGLRVYRNHMEILVYAVK